MDAGLTGTSYTFGGSNPQELEGAWSYRIVASAGGSQATSGPSAIPVTVDRMSPTTTDDVAAGWIQTGVVDVTLAASDGSGSGSQRRTTRPASIRRTRRPAPGSMTPPTSRRSETVSRSSTSRSTGPGMPNRYIRLRRCSSTSSRPIRGTTSTPTSGTTRTSSSRSRPPTSSRGLRGSTTRRASTRRIRRRARPCTTRATSRCSRTVR